MTYFSARFPHLRTLSLALLSAGNLLLAQPVAAQLLSFPGAEGAGRFVRGGRGTTALHTTVFEVTSLADSNTPGTLRYACSQSATANPYRTIVFRVCGTIHLINRLSIPRNTTIAGQTAPGDGICVADKETSVSGDNVIIRFVRFRLGDRYQKLTNAAGQAINGSGGEDALNGNDHKGIIVDHCTMSWSNDEAFTFYGATTDSMTLQWNMISEPLNYSYHFETGDTDYEHHGYGGIWGGKRASFHHNLFAHCNSRTPRWNGTRYGAAIGSENCDFSNNVIYDWGSNNAYGGEGGNYNMVNNYYKFGPSTTSSSSRSRIYNPYKQTTAPILPYPRTYLSGNFVAGATVSGMVTTNTSVTNDNWKGVTMNGGTAADTALSKVTVAFPIAPINLQMAEDAYNSVLAGVGCLLPVRDPLDQRILNDVRNRTGTLIDVQGGFPAHTTPYSVSQVAWPVLSCGPAPADTDHDGMTDAYEAANGLNSNDPTDRYGIAGNGYTNLENYLNGLVPLTVAYPTGPLATRSANLTTALQVYPNPAHNQLTLAHPAASSGASVAVYNFLGQQVKTLTPTPGSQETVVSVEGLALGPYFMVYKDGESRGSCRFVRE